MYSLSPLLVFSVVFLAFGSVKNRNELALGIKYHVIIEFQTESFIVITGFDFLSMVL